MGEEVGGENEELPKNRAATGLFECKLTPYVAIRGRVLFRGV